MQSAQLAPAQFVAHVLHVGPAQPGLQTHFPVPFVPLEQLPRPHKGGHTPVHNGPKWVGMQSSQLSPPQFASQTHLPVPAVPFEQLP